MRGSLIALGISIVTCASSAALVACTHDFDQFASSTDATASGGDASGGTDATSGQDAADGASPVDAATGDSSSQDAGVDAPCIPSQSCLGDASACATACTTTEQQCVQGCGNNNGCKQQCRNKGITCRGQCGQACAACTLAAGCAATTECDAATSGG